MPAHAHTNGADTTPRAPFGTLLRQHRIAAGLSQQALAERAGMSLRGISDLERGLRRAPQRETVRLLAWALGLTAGEHAQLEAVVERRRGARIPVVPTASGDSMPALPGYLSTFIGREHDVAMATALLRQPAVRLLTLTGPGGVGKTRLAIQVAAGLRETFPDGVFFVDLAPISHALLVISTIAHALGVRESRGQSIRESLMAHLRERQVLLLLDNFEHVPVAAIQIAELLVACPLLKALVTSRAVLRVQGEQELAVTPLALPDSMWSGDVDALTKSPAVALFLQRARSVVPAFALTAENAPAVVAICTRLDGLPLALELAAVWIKYLSPWVLKDWLEHRLAVLVDGPRDLPARQQTLRDTIAWSYDLLDADEQILFRRLAVFAGGCTLDAVTTVCLPVADEPGQRSMALRELTSLADKNLLQVRPGSDGEPRFVMLETIREYALERLNESAESLALAQRHATYMLGLAETAEPAIIGVEQVAWLHRLEQEHDNLRVALRWAMGADDTTPRREIGGRIAGALRRFWFMRGHLDEGRRWLEALLDSASAEHGVSAPVRANLLCSAGFLVFRQGDNTRAAALLEESLRVYAGIGTSARTAVNHATALLYLAMVAGDHGDNTRAVALYEESLARFESVGNKHGTALALNGLGNVARVRGDYGEAGALYEQGQALFREVGDAQALALVLSNLGHVAREQGDCERAAVLYGDTLPLYRTLEDRHGIARALTNLAEVAQQYGDDERAAALYTESLALFRDLGIAWGIARALTGLGTVAQDRGEYARATAHYGESLSLLQMSGRKVSVAYCLEGVAGVARAQGQPQRAARLYGAAAALRDSIGVPLPPAYRDSYEHALAALRTALGHNAFAAAFDAGQCMSLADALADAQRPHPTFSYG